MDFTLIALLVTILSGGWILFILRRKAKELTEVEPYPIDIEPVIEKAKKRIEKVNVFNDLVIVVFLEKLLRKLRVLMQKAENVTIKWLEHLRVNYKNENPNPIFSDEYWDSIKNKEVQLGKKKSKQKEEDKPV